MVNVQRITDSEEIARLMNSSNPADRARAVYLMLLVTHPEIQGDPSQKGSEVAGGYVFWVEIGEQNVALWIKISEDLESDRGLLAGTTLSRYETRGNPVPPNFKGESSLPMIMLTVYQGAFQSLAHLYHVIGHEGVHAYELITGKGKTSEANAYMWNLMHAYSPFPYPWGIGLLINSYRLSANSNLYLSSSLVE